MATIAAVVAMSQWQVALSSARTGTAMTSNIKARAIADACLEKWLRYAKDGVDTGTWTDFDDLLDPSGSATPSDEDFIPDDQATECTAGVTYVPSSMSIATGLRRGLHRYCGIRMDGGVCLMRFDDNSDDGKAGGVLSTDTGTEGADALSGDEPRRDRDFSVLVTTIGLYPASSATPIDQLYARAEARSTKRALLQIEIQASTTGWPAIHTKDVVQLANGPGSNWAVKACGTGGIAAANGVTPSAGGQTDDGCVCGNQKMPGTNPLQSTCTGCGAEGCATGDIGPYVAATDALDDDACHDGTTASGCIDGNNEFDPDKPPPLPAHPVFYTNNSTSPPNWRVAAPAMAFGRSIPNQTSATYNVPRWITGDLPDPSPATGDPTNPICTYFFGGPTAAKGRVTINTGAAVNEAPANGTPHSGYNRSPRVVYVWDHSDVALQDTLTATSWSTALTFAGTPPATWAPFVAPDAVSWPMVSDRSCRAWAQPYLPPPCDWNFSTTSGEVTGLTVDLSTCRVPQSLCWRPIALLDEVNTSGSFDAYENSYFLKDHGPGSGSVAKNREPTDEDNEVEIFNPPNGIRVPLIRGGAALTERTFGQFCGNTSSLSGTSPGDEGPFFSKSTGRWRILDDMPDDEWTSRGAYFIFDSEGNTAARALTIESELGSDDDDKLKIGFIVDGPVMFDSSSDHYVCCPTCTCVDNGGSPTSVSNWNYSSGYFLFARGPCAFRDPVKDLTGDILCESVGIRHSSGVHAETIYGDVLATGDCQQWGDSACSLNAAEMATLMSGGFPTWCLDTLVGPQDDPGICMDTQIQGHNTSDLTSQGPWVGHLWAKRDITIRGPMAFGVRPSADAATGPPYFPTANPHVPVATWPEPLHPDWPAIFSMDDVGLANRGTILGKIQSLETTEVGNRITIYGRVVAGHNIRFGSSLNPTNGQNVIIWDGSGTSTTAVSDSIFYQDLGW